MKADGTILGLRAQIVCPLGTALVNSAAVTPYNHARLLPGAYVIPACDIESRGAFTTTAPIGAYRGAGRPEAAFLIERLMDEAARARLAASPCPRPSSTPPWTRWRPSASATWTCRSPPRKSGGRFTPLTLPTRATR